MQVSRPLIDLLFSAASMRRWSDKIRPADFRELDKQAHKMVVAYVIGKYEEHKPDFNWVEVIEGGIFELLQRIVTTDVKPPVFRHIMQDAETRRDVNEWVFAQLRGCIEPLGNEFCERFRAYFDGPPTTAKRVLEAAHYYPTAWEYQILRKATPEELSYETNEIQASLQADLERCKDLRGMKNLLDRRNISRFVNLCGELRFQLRWSQLEMRPRTSVLGHMLIVAVLSYLFSRSKQACDRRCYNNFFTGLFHDFPEVLTRDIISPVKRSSERVEKAIKAYETQHMEEEVYKSIPSTWRSEMRLFTKDEFGSVAKIHTRHERCDPSEIDSLYNRDECDARDGHLVWAVDQLAAFVEAHLAHENGARSYDLMQAMVRIRDPWVEGKNAVLGLNFASIYQQYEP